MRRRFKRLARNRWTILKWKNIEMLQLRTYAVQEQLDRHFGSRCLLRLQEEIEKKIELVDALAVKLLQQFNFSVSAMKTTSQHLSEVHALQVELGELKGRLTEVISNCDALCKRIESEGPESLRSSVTPFIARTANSCDTNSPLQRVLESSLASTESKTG